MVDFLASLSAIAQSSLHFGKCFQRVFGTDPCHGFVGVVLGGEATSNPMPSPHDLESGFLNVFEKPMPPCPMLD